MREIIQFQIGGCGINISQKIWSKMINEHIDEESKDNEYINQRYMDTYFKQSNDGKYTPRSIIADYDPESAQAVLNGPLKDFFEVDNIFSGIGGDFRTFAETHYTESKSIMDPIKEVIRKEVEQCDNLQGVQIVAGIGGATGSGLSA